MIKNQIPWARTLHELDGINKIVNKRAEIQIKNHPFIWFKARGLIELGFGSIKGIKVFQVFKLILIFVRLDQWFQFEGSFFLLAKGFHHHLRKIMKVHWICRLNLGIRETNSYNITIFMSINLSKFKLTWVKFKGRI